EKLSDQYAAIYAKRSGNSVERVREMMRDETWLDSNEAVDLGFADAASSEGASANAPTFDYRLFRNPPATLVARAQQDFPSMTTKTKTKTDAAQDDESLAATASADVTADILNRCAIAKMSAAETQEIIAKAKGNLDIARDAIIDAVA